MTFHWPGVSRLKVHTQPGGQHVATRILPDGRTIRVCGGRTRAGDDAVRKGMWKWLEWERKGRPS